MWRSRGLGGIRFGNVCFPYIYILLLLFFFFFVCVYVCMHVCVCEWVGVYLCLFFPCLPSCYFATLCFIYLL